MCMPLKLRKRLCWTNFSFSTIFVIQGDANLVCELPEALMLICVDRFQNPFSHLPAQVVDLFEHIQSNDTCTLTWESDHTHFTAFLSLSATPRSLTLLLVKFVSGAFSIDLKLSVPIIIESSPLPN